MDFMNTSAAQWEDLATYVLFFVGGPPDDRSAGLVLRPMGLWLAGP